MANNVRELIEELSHVDPEAPVATLHPPYGGVKLSVQENGDVLIGHTAKARQVADRRKA